MAQRVVLLLFFAAANASGQALRFGVEAGVPLTDYFETGRSGSLHGSAGYSAATRRYTVGAAVEWSLRARFGFELDSLYHRMGYVALVNYFDSANGNFTNSAIDVKGNSWDFPLMAVYRLPFAKHARLRVMGGGVLRYLGPVRGLGRETRGSLAGGTGTTTPLDTSQPSELRKRLYPGLTAGAGLELGRNRLRFLPEFRLNHWTANIAGPGGLLRFASNQAEILAGVRF